VLNVKKGQSTFDIQTLFSEKVVRRMKYIQARHYGVFFGWWNGAVLPKCFVGGRVFCFLQKY